MAPEKEALNQRSFAGVFGHEKTTNRVHTFSLGAYSSATLDKNFIELHKFYYSFLNMLEKHDLQAAAVQDHAEAFPNDPEFRPKVPELPAPTDQANAAANQAALEAANQADLAAANQAARAPEGQGNSAAGDVNMRTDGN